MQNYTGIYIYKITKIKNVFTKHNYDKNLKNQITKHL